MFININLLQKLGVTVDQVNEGAKTLQENLGDKVFLKTFENKNEMSLGDLNLLLERSAIIRRLSSKVGFRRVIKEISATPNSSLSAPLGSWFQLKVGFIVNVLGEEPAFEQKVGRSPKDILLRNEQIHIECKSFLLSPIIEAIYTEHGKVFEAIGEKHPIGNWHIQINRDIDDGNPLNDLISVFHSNTLEDIIQGIGSDKGIHISILTGYEPFGVVPPGEEFPTLAFAGIEHTSDTLRTPFSMFGNDKLAIQISGPRLDQFGRIENAIITKKPQMISGICNIIALEIDSHIGDIGYLKLKLSEFFIPKRDNAISGLLIILHEQEPETGKSIVRMEVIENSHAQIKIPEDLLKKFRGEHKVKAEQSQ